MRGNYCSFSINHINGINGTHPIYNHYNYVTKFVNNTYIFIRIHTTYGLFSETLEDINNQ